MGAPCGPRWRKGFNRAFRTVLAADFSSFIAAFIL